MDVAAVTINYLDEATSITWYHNAPSSLTEFGTLTRDGGQSEIVRDMPTLTLLVYGASRGASAGYAYETKQALLAMPYEVDNVFTAEILGDYYDPLDGKHRHRITATLTVND